MFFLRLSSSPALIAALIALPLSATKAQFVWDATGGAAPGNGTVEDGAGTWDNATTANWTQDGGTTNVNYTPAETSTVTIGSGGAGGTVTISNAGSPILLGELILGPASSPYTIAGDGLDFTTGGNTTSNITVGSNSVISAPITKLNGNGNLVLRRSGTTTNNDLTISSDNATTMTNQTRILQEVWLRLNHQNGVGTSGNLRLDGTDARIILGGTQVTGDATFTLQKNVYVNTTGSNKTIQLTGGTSNTATLSGTLTLLENVTSHFSINPNANDDGVELGQVLTVTGRITGTGFANGENAMVMTGNGVLRLDPTANNNNFRGRVNLNSENAVLIIAESGALANPTDGGVAAADATEVRFNQGGQVLLSDGVVTHAANDMVLNNNGINKLLGLEDGATSATWGGPIVNSEATANEFDLRANSGQTLTLAGIISGGGAAGITTVGDGTVLLTGASNYSGPTTIGTGNNQATNTLQIGVDSVGSVGSITSSAIGTGTLSTQGARISSDGTTARTILNAVSFDAGGGSSVFLGDTTNTGLLTFEGAGTLTGARTIAVDSATIFNGAIGESTAGGGSITKTGSATLTLGGVNTYTGDTNINAGTVTLANSGELLFDIDSDGTNLANHTNITGGGTADFDGTFRFDLATADINDGNSWNLVNVGTLTETFGTNFAVTSTAGAFSDIGSSHELVDGTNKWTFTEATGDLTLAIIPEPSAGALIALSGLALLRRRRRV